MQMQEEREGKVYYHITTVSQLLHLSPGMIMRYERLGLIRCEMLETDDESSGRCYSYETLDRLRRIQWLTEGMGINLAGVEVILHLLERLEKA